MIENRGEQTARISKTGWVVMVVLALALATGGVILARHWPFSRDLITQSLLETFPATVTFQNFHPTYFPHPGCVGEGVIFKRLGSAPGTPPIVTVERISWPQQNIDVLRFNRYAREGDREPLRFDIHSAKLSSVSRDKPLSYEVSMRNALPPGEVRAHGQFG